MFSFFPQWQRFLGSLSSLPSRPILELEEEYVRVFMHNPDYPPCFPYESIYVDHGEQGVGWLIALVEREYATAGLALSPSFKDLPDHIAVELEFMAFLCAKEAEAWGGGSHEEGVRLLERQASFLGRHLALWVPRWARGVAVVGRGGIYPVVAEAVEAFISHDQELVGLLLEWLCTGREAKSWARPWGQPQ